jgi:hypothetical protein
LDPSSCVPVSRHSAGVTDRRPEPLVEGVDYTIEGGFWVFTAHYLLKRGYCCQSGCRNCPYGFCKDPRRDER